MEGGAIDHRCHPGLSRSELPAWSDLKIGAVAMCREAAAALSLGSASDCMDPRHTFVEHDSDAMHDIHHRLRPSTRVAVVGSLRSARQVGWWKWIT
jgi:hypothetical protein